MNSIQLLANQDINAHALMKEKRFLNFKNVMVLSLKTTKMPNKAIRKREIAFSAVSRPIRIRSLREYEIRTACINKFRTTGNNKS